MESAHGAPRVTDIHVHVEPWTMLKPAIRATFERSFELKHLDAITASPAAFLDFLDGQGIWRAAIINYVSPEIMGFTDEVNEFCARFCDHDRRRLIPFGCPDLANSSDAKSEMRKLLDDLGLRGIKIHPPHQAISPAAYREGFRAQAILYEECSLRGVPVMIHTGTSIFQGARSRLGDPMPIDDVCVDYPELKVILAHGGRPLWMDECFFLLRRHANVYLDISSIPPASLLRYFPRIEEVASKTMFGSDWPSPGVPEIRRNVDQIKALPLSPKALRQILETTALSIFPDA